MPATVGGGASELCALCMRPAVGTSRNSPHPLAEDPGWACDECNQWLVIPARLAGAVTGGHARCRTFPIPGRVDSAGSRLIATVSNGLLTVDGGPGVRIVLVIDVSNCTLRLVPSSAQGLHLTRLSSTGIRFDRADMLAFWIEIDERIPIVDAEY
jgi:hypothetical protein